MAGQRIELPAYSMWSATPVYEVSSTIVFGLMKAVVVPDASDELYTVSADGVHRLDTISNLVYGTPALWWVIASVNSMLDPLVGVPLNTRIRVPTKARLASEGVLNV